MAQTQAGRDIAAIQAAPERLERFRVPSLTGGLRTNRASYDIEPTETPSIVNLDLIAGVLQADTGYSRFGQPYGGAAYFGQVQRTYQTFNTDGTNTEFLVTTATVYTYNTTFNQWQIAPWGAFYTQPAQINAGAGSTILTSAAGLVIGNFLGLPLDDGEQLPVTITLVAGNLVNFTPPVPPGRFVPANSNICLGATLHGSISHQVSIVPFPANGWTIFTNSVDPIFYFDKTKLGSLVTASDLPAATTAHCLAVFHECLFLLHTVENGTEFPQRVRMSNLADLLNWTPGGLAGASIAAIYDLIDTADYINFGATLGPYLILYRDNSIMRGTYLGVPNNIIFWEYMVDVEGCGETGGVVELGSRQLFLGRSSIYLYQGDYKLTDTGDAVFFQTFLVRGGLNSTAKDTIFSVYVPVYGEAWLFYPSGTNTTPDQMLRVKLDGPPAWYTRRFANKMLSCQPYTAVKDTPWSSLVGTWVQQVFVWDSRVFTANAPVLLLCSSDDNQVYSYDYSSTTDNGHTISWSLQTKDITSGDEFQRWDSVRCYGQGNSVLCEYSLNEGLTFITIGTLNFGSSPSLRILTFQAVSAYIRIRLSGTDPTFQFHWLEVWYSEESEWGLI